MCSIKGIIFDYGGTIDTNGIHWGELIWEQYCKEGINIDKETYRDAYVHGERSLAKSPIVAATDTFRTLLQKKMALQFAYLRERLGNTGTFTEEKESMVAERCYDKAARTIETARPLLEALRERFPMVLVTNFYGNMPVVLKEFMLENIFTTIVESSVVGIRKPDPALFELGVKALGLRAEETVVIGDSYRKDIYPAATLGCRTVWLKKVCWADEPIEKGYEPTAVADTLALLPEILENI